MSFKECQVLPLGGKNVLHVEIGKVHNKEHTIKQARVYFPGKRDIVKLEVVAHFLNKRFGVRKN